jgi:hypothetical protein
MKGFAGWIHYDFLVALNSCAVPIMTLPQAAPTKKKAFIVSCIINLLFLVTILLLLRLHPIEL